MYLIAKAVLFKKNKIKTNLRHIVFYVTELQISDIYKLKLYYKGKEDECSYFKYDTNFFKINRGKQGQTFSALEQNFVLGS